MRPSTGTGGILYPAAATTAFELTRFEPGPALAPYIERHWVVRWSVADSFVQPMVAHPCVNLTIEPERAAVHGIVTRRASKALEGAGRVVATKFRPGAFRPFWGRSVHELNDRAVDLEQVFGPAASVLASDVRACPGDADAVALLEDFLVERLPEPDSAMMMVVEAARLVLEDTELTRVTDLAARMGVSPRRLQRQFREYVGIGPKLMIRRARIHRAAAILSAGGSVDLAGLAVDLGYADQAHFAHDFRAEVGRAPNGYRRACG